MIDNIRPRGKKSPDEGLEPSTTGLKVLRSTKLSSLRVLRAGENLPSLSQLHEFDAVTVVVIRLAQLVERGLHGGRRRLEIERGKFFGRDGTRAREERRLKQLGQWIHE